MIRVSVVIACLAALAVPVGGAAAEDEKAVPKVTISAKDCQRLVRHRGQQDADYKPGVDVRGRIVAPADVEGSPKLKIPEEITFELNASLAKYFARPGLDNPILTSEGLIGRLKFNILTGKLTFDGQRVSDPATDEVVALCRDVLERGE